MLSDWRSAPIDERLRATLGLLEMLTLRPADVGPAAVESVRNVGVSDQAIEDAVLVCTLFQIIDRVADALDFAVPEHQRNAPFMPAHAR